MMEEDQRIKKILLNDEEVIWCGKPHADSYILSVFPYVSLAWLAFAAVVMFGHFETLMPVKASSLLHGIMLTVLFTSPGWAGIGLFFARIYERRVSFLYVITNQRVIQQRGIFKLHYLSTDLGLIREVTYINEDTIHAFFDKGSISFGLGVNEYGGTNFLTQMDYIEHAQGIYKLFKIISLKYNKKYKFNNDPNPNDVLHTLEKPKRKQREMGLSRFDPEFYSLYRPFYPTETFTGFEKQLFERGFTKPYVIADIGCGTGHSTVSLLQTGIQTKVIGIDPDFKMLEAAKKIAVDHPEIEWKKGSGEKTGLDNQSVDGAMIGSAFHWMNAFEVKQELLRIIKPRGIIRIFEYQFPKANELPELNDWIKREFNLRWKAPGQKPRGNLKDLTSVFREDSQFEFLGEDQPEMKLKLDADQLVGLILSQSRVLHYEDTLDEVSIIEFRKSLSDQIYQFMGARRSLFDFKLAWVEFSLSSIKK